MSRELNTEERGRLEELFDEASELPAEEHGDFVARVCGDNAVLRGELTRLLSGLVGEDFLGQISPRTPSRVGTQIGSYELLALLGEGGMGEVYDARQHDPIERRVALKVIKAGMYSAQVVARFQAERQTLALMEHENIARILDGGTTGDGHPYFVMEFVEGQPISDYCDQHRLSTRDRIELFLGLCDGVQHAHQKGVIHRDLKPSNLMVTEQGGRAVPKIIDFGVARATNEPSVGRTLNTMLGQIVGTLDYMSPEQADPSIVDIDTRADIYSLGVVLYQLLSGLLPFEKQLGTEVPFSEAQRILREQDPPTPSARVRRQTGTETSVAPLRSTSEQALLRQLSGDLDWICLKALEKEPARRYPSVSEFATDLRRHLANEPVLARRPGRLYLARKFVLRHRVGVLAGVAVGAAVIAGLGGVVSGEVRAEVQEQIARDEAAKNLRLSDMVDLERLVAEADGLWPPYPARIDEFKDWIGRARELLARREIHSEALRELERLSFPWTEVQQLRDREVHPLAGELANRQSELAFWVEELENDGLRPARRRRFESRVAAITELEIPPLLEQVQSRQTWEFERPADAWWHPRLQQLIAKMDELETTFLAAERVTSEHGWSLPMRVEVAQRLEIDFGEGGKYFHAWANALPEIHTAQADMDGNGTEELVYPGLSLTPQMGLVPLGPDPHSHLWEFSHVLSGDPVERDADGELIKTDTMGVVLVLLPKGTFMMGAVTDAQGEHFDPLAIPFMEAPQHWVSIDEEFFLSKFELTEAQWFEGTREVARRPGWAPGDGQELLPVDVVSWEEVTKYTAYQGLMLPHERQWEYGARAGTQTVWSTGSDDALSIEGYANLFDVAAVEAFPYFEREAGGHWQGNDGYPMRAPVGTFLPNRFGLHDVHGNVAEWCGNSPYMYPNELDWQSGDARASRGGNARGIERDARSSSRRSGPAAIKGPGFGFRPARRVER